MRHRVRRAGTLLCTAALVLAGCGGGTGASSGSAFDPNAIFRYAVPGMPTSFDPRRSAPLDPVFLDAVYESLVERTPGGELKPGLATTWSFSDDHTSLTLALREGVTFHNGTPFDSSAVVASLNAFRAEGAQATALATVSGVEALGEHEVRIDFTEPSGHILNVLAGEAGIVVEPTALEAPDLGTKPVGTGPFELTDLRPGKITFTRFDEYWDAENTTIGGIEMTVFNDEPTRLRSVVSGETDGTTISTGQVAEARAGGLSIVTGPSSTVFSLLLNTARSELGDALVRRALVYAIDREAISESLFDGDCTPTAQPFTEEFWPHVPELDDVAAYHDPAKARRFLAEAGLPDGFPLEIVHLPNTSFADLGQILQAQLKEIGVDARLRTLEFTQMIEATRNGEFTATIQRVQVTRPDPSQFVADYYLPGGAYNPGDLSLDGVADLLAKSRAGSEETERRGPTRQIITDVLAAGPPVIPICGVHWAAAFRPGVTGFEVPTMGDYDFASITINH
jgi:peptide/nickel transport system substrate-binding protein